jgi:hypothetical protein
VPCPVILILTKRYTEMKVQATFTVDINVESEDVRTVEEIVTDIIGYGIYNIPDTNVSVVQVKPVEPVFEFTVCRNSLISIDAKDKDLALAILLNNIVESQEVIQIWHNDEVVYEQGQL